MKTYLTILLSIFFTFSAKAYPALREQIQHIIGNAEAEIGVAVIINGKDTLTFNNEAHYPLMSVMKYHQALAVAHYLDQRDLPLSTHIRIEKQDLRPDTYSPLRDKYPNGGISLSIGELLTYTLQLSDNNACDILFEYIGGTKASRFPQPKMICIRILKDATRIGALPFPQPGSWIVSLPGHCP